VSTANDEIKRGPGRPPKDDELERLRIANEELVRSLAQKDAQLSEMINGRSADIPVVTVRKGRQWRFELWCDAVQPDGKQRLGKPAIPRTPIEAVDESEAKRIFAIHPSVKAANYGRVIDTADRDIHIRCLDEEERNLAIAKSYAKAGHPMPDGLISSVQERALRDEAEVERLRRKKELEVKAGLQPASV
jgi:hypothetical protein